MLIVEELESTENYEVAREKLKIQEPRDSRVAVFSLSYVCVYVVFLIIFKIWLVTLDVQLYISFSDLILEHNPISISFLNSHKNSL